MLTLSFFSVHHRQEKLSKSSAVHAKVIAPENVLFHHDDRNLPPSKIELSEETLLLFPSPSAKTLAEIGVDELAKFKRVAVIDGTWVKATAAVNRISNLDRLTHVRLNEYQTMFWRFQKIGQHERSFLSSIEAIYYFYKEHFAIMNPGMEYDGRFDNLLYFFVRFASDIANSQEENSKRKPERMSGLQASHLEKKQARDSNSDDLLT